VVADPGQLEQLLQNLISNGLKFHGEAAPRVAVSAAREAAAWRVTVEDNGIGIEPKYADRIFKMFQRLHGRDAYAGTGIGLAVCKRIVERHGGRIWLEAPESGGARFCFTLGDPEAVA
jgi:light-regulated signal transduction histidine kinase (bacteriophytochrome)